MLESEAAGIVAALSAPFLMTLGFLFWEENWKGSAFSLNLFKCSTASVGFLIFSLTLTYQRGESGERDGSIFPRDVFTVEVIGFLFLSSTIGIVIGDWTWLQALKILGAKHVIMVDSLKPFVAALFGWLLLGEKLRQEAFGGIILTVIGIAVVSMEQQVDRPDAEGNVEMDASEALEPASLPKDDEENCREKRASRVDPLNSSVVGFGLAFLNVILDTYGSVLTKQFGVRLTVWEINLLRFGFAAAVMLMVSITCYMVKFVGNGLRWTTSADQCKTTSWFMLPFRSMEMMDWLKVSGGVALVTFATPALSNFALFQIALALALTLGSIGPLYQLPLSYLIKGRRITLRSTFGALCAVTGVAVLAFRGEVPESGD